MENTNTAAQPSGTLSLDSLTRYEPEVGSDGYGVRAEMSEYPGCGDYVKFEDVAALIAQARAAQPAGAADTTASASIGDDAKFRELLTAVWSGWHPKFSSAPIRNLIAYIDSRATIAPVATQQAAAVECGKCNDSGIVGFPPDQYESCPDCTRTINASGPTSEQNARFAIDAAIQYGRENRNQPPSTDHWLYEYWNIGRQLAKLGETAWDNVTSMAAAKAPAAQAVDAGEPANDLRQAARDLYNATVADTDVRITSTIKEKRDIAAAAADRLRVALLRQLPGGAQRCQAARCQDQDSHCNGACHGVSPDGSPLALNVPDEYVLVPRKITEEMHVAAVRAVVRATGNDDFPPAVWAAMLAASPASTPEASQQGEAPIVCLACSGANCPTCKANLAAPAAQQGAPTKPRGWLAGDELFYASLAAAQRSCDAHNAYERSRPDFDEANLLEPEPVYSAVPTTAGMVELKDHNVRQLVDDLTAIGQKFGATQQLRARVSGAVTQFLGQQYGWKVAAERGAGMVEDAKDAARYRWLRNKPIESGHLPISGDMWVVQYEQHPGTMPELRSAGFGTALDARIDHAVAVAAQQAQASAKDEGGAA